MNLLLAVDSSPPLFAWVMFFGALGLFILMSIFPKAP